MYPGGPGWDLCYPTTSVLASGGEERQRSQRCLSDLEAQPLLQASPALRPQKVKACCGHR